MPRRPRTIQLIETAREILEVGHPMTVRQVYYQLVSRQVIENNRGQYQAVSNALVCARKEGIIPWHWIEDRLRRPRHVSMWNGLDSFAETCRVAYRRNIWENQSCYIEAWLEKDALSGIFEDVLNPYGVTLNVGRGYDGWDSIRNAADRFEAHMDVTVLYFGDFDPSGEDMVRSLTERLEFFGCYPEIVKCALVPEDIARYSLPPDFAKKTDSRASSFIALHGDISVELDALPSDVLRGRLTTEIESRMDLKALKKTQRQEETERKRIKRALEALA